jgi:serine/threonine protein kinase
VKIADFGVARHEASNPSDMTGETGTLAYMAPEVPFHGQAHSSPLPQVAFHVIGYPHHLILS